MPPNSIHPHRLSVLQAATVPQGLLDDRTARTRRIAGYSLRLGKISKMASKVLAPSLTALWGLQP